MSNFLILFVFSDELDAITNGDGIAPKPPKRIRQMKPNEIIFADALPTEFKSKDQVVLMRNPSGVGLWPALVSVYVIYNS